jgi:RecA-family ATPase
MPYYYCAFPNDKAARLPRFHLITSDAAERDAFVAKHDVPGYALYWCPNPLKDGLPNEGSSRCLDNVERVERLFWDIDHKDLLATPEEVDDKLLQLPVEPTMVTDSGGGRHIYVDLNEPIEADDTEMLERVRELQKVVAGCLSADPAPAHPAALMRWPGSHNSKRGEPVEVKTLWASGKPSDITDWEAVTDLLPAEGIFERKHKPAPNGHAKPNGSGGPVDVDERLAAMRYEGPGDTSIHVTQLACTGSLVRSGVPMDDVVDQVMSATRDCMRDDPRAAGWNWDDEERDVRGMCYDLVDDSPELGAMLPDGLRAQFNSVLAQGKRAKIIHAKGRGWHVRGYEQPEAQKGKEKPTRTSFKILLFSSTALVDLPPREFLYGAHYQRGIVSATVAPGGTGKSSVSLAEAIAMATGRPLLGEQPKERCKVWVHNGDDKRDELYRRAWGICLHHGIPPEELDGWLYLTSAREVPLKVASGYDKLLINDVLIARLLDQVRECEIDVAIFDPLVTLHDVNEQDNSRMGAVMEVFTSIAEECDAAADLVHHTRKLRLGEDEHTNESSRGASAIGNAVRAVRILNVMSASEADKLGVDEADRLKYLRVDNGKRNYTPPQAAAWRRFVSVDLPNTDNVGVVEQWICPGQGADSDAARNTAEHVFMAILVRFTLEGRKASSTKQGGNYAPNLFAKENEAKLAKVGKSSLEDAMRRLFEAKRIRLDGDGKRGSRLVVT